jgi:hypothetical protein
VRWHHSLVVIGWNASLIVFFLPGQPSLATVLACLSLGVSLLDRTMGKMQFLKGPETGWPLVLIGIVVLVTAALTGGVGGRAFGSEMWGARRYLGVFGAIIGYYAITAKRIPLERAKFLASGFFLSGATAIGSDLAYAAGPTFYVLFALFSADVAMLQITSKETMMRFTGVAWSSLALFYFMLMRYGIRGVLDFTRPWRFVVFMGVAVVGLLGGYRSSILIMGIVFVVQFYMEGLFRTRLFPAVLLAVLLGGAILGLPIGLILLEPDVGQAITYLPLLAVVLFLSSVRLWIVAAVLVGCIAGAPLAYTVGVKTGLLHGYKLERINVILDPGQPGVIPFFTDPRRTPSGRSSGTARSSFGQQRLVRV